MKKIIFSLMVLMPEITLAHPGAHDLSAITHLMSHPFHVGPAFVIGLGLAYALIKKTNN